MTGGSTRITPNPFLRGCLGPQLSLASQDAPCVQGEIPAELCGLYVRNGPNPIGAPRDGHHWFEGDGMVHGTWLSNGVAWYANRFVESSSFLLNKQSAVASGLRYYFSTFADLRGRWRLVHFLLSRMLCGILRVFSFLPASWVTSRWGVKSTQNTALLYHHNVLYALVEANVPIRLSPQSLTTIGEDTFDGKLQHAFTAHPKICPVTNECFFFCYQPDRPGCILSALDSKGVKLPSVQVTLRFPVMMHDFALTDSYIVLLDLPLTFDPKNIVKGRGIVSWKFGEACRLGVVRRSCISDRTQATSASLLRSTFDDHNPAHLREVPVEWFTMSEPCYIFHVASCYEEREPDDRGAVVHLYALRHPEGFDIDYLAGFDVRKHAHDHPLTGQLVHYTLHIGTGRLDESHSLAPFYGEFPIVPAQYLTQKTPYCYVSVAPATMPVDVHNPIPLCALAKYDLDTMSIVSLQQFQPNAHVGEFSFVPRRDAARHDDGYLVGYVTVGPKDDRSVQSTDQDGKDRYKSFLYVLSALDLSVVAVVSLPHRVPLGFHGTFVPNVLRN